MSKKPEFNYKPTKNKVVIAPDEVEKQTETGIFIPETAQVIPNRGTIVAMGPECSEQIKVGSHVVYGKTTGFTVELDDKEVYKMMTEPEILLIKIK